MKKPSKQGVKAIVLIVAVSLYLSIVPYFIVIYGVRNEIEGFTAGVPFHGMYSTVGMMWFFGHVLVGILLLCFYMLLWGCNNDQREGNKNVRQR